MKNLFLLVLAFTACLLSTGCNSDDFENEPVLMPELKIDSETTIVVPYVGGSYTIRYTLENVDNERPYADASCDWITVLSHTATEARIKVDPLVDAPRTGTVTLSYPECNNITVTFNQKEIEPFSECISLSVEQITMNSATVVVSNPYEDYWVCPRVETKSFYDMQIAPDPAKWIETYCDKNSSIGMFMSWRNYYYQNYGNNPKTFPDYYSISKADGNSHTFSNLQPDTEYVAFGIEVDPFCNATGEIVSKSFTTEPLPPVETIDLSFDVEASLTSRSGDYCYIDLKVIPSNTTVPYLCICSFTPTLESSIDTWGDLQGYIENYLDLYFSSTAASEIHTGVWQSADLRLYTWDLTDNCPVSIVLCGCDEFGRITSQIVRKDFELPIQ